MMSKKPFDHIENKIREAAENSEPPFNEHAWEKMELLLNKEEKTKRRFFIWWRFGLPLLLAGLLGGGYLLFLNAPGNKKIAGIAPSQTTATDNTEKKNSSVPVGMDSKTPVVTDVKNNAGAAEDLNTSTVKTQPISAATPGANDKPASIKKTLVNSAPGPETPVSSITAVVKKTSVKEIFRKRNLTDSKPGADVTTTKQLAGKKKKLSTKGSLTVSSVAEYATLENPALMIDQRKTSDITDYGSTAAKDTIKTDAIKDSLFVTSLQKKKETDSSSAKEQPYAKAIDKKKDKKAAGSKFYIVAEGGIEILKTKALSYNNAVLSGRYGAAIGYEISKRLNVQAGFYAGRKKYTGGPGDYHPKQGTYWSMVNIKQVDADCLVYDIPISLRYNFAAKKTFQWYAMAGISSFIMKKEDYNYYYTYNGMPDMVHQKPYSYTGNKSLFSILTLSAGFERKISNRTSFIAEPYISLPLAGVGDGAVKLYSTGLQVGIKYKPKF